MDHDRADADTYWQERGNGKFVLRVDGIERAVADANNNTAVILSMPGSPAWKFTVPESQTVFDGVEQSIGIRRVEQFRTKHGTRTMIGWRHMAEQRAQHFRSQHPPATEARHYAQQAWHLLNEKSKCEALSNQANDARLMLGLLLLAVDNDQDKWSADSQRRLEQARDFLREAPQTPDQLFTPAAKRHCEMAVAVLEREQQSDRGKAKDDLTDRVLQRLRKIKEREHKQNEKSQDQGREHD